MGTIEGEYDGALVGEIVGTIEGEYDGELVGDKLGELVTMVGIAEGIFGGTEHMRTFT